MKKIMVLLYAVISYVIGLFAVAYYADFFVGQFVPDNINSGGPSDVGHAVLVNTALLIMFCIPHSLIARPEVKTWMRKYIPYPMERSTYIWVSSLLLLMMCFFWQPIPMAVFDLAGTIIEPVFWTLYGVGWFLTLFSTFLIDHFDLFGLKQAWNYGSNNASNGHKFATPLLYKFVRHPIYLGWLLIHWFNPYFSVGQMLMAVIVTAYIFAAIAYEERDLVVAFGDTYLNYKKATPKIFPTFRIRSK